MIRAFATGGALSTLICSATFAYFQHGQLAAYLFVGIVAQVLVLALLLNPLMFGYVGWLFRERTEEKKEKLTA